MEENFRKKMLYFDGNTDLTFREIKIWKAFLNSVVETHKSYFNNLNESANILKSIAKSDDEKKTTGENTRFAANMMQEVLGMMGVFHRDVLGDSEKYTGIHGPFTDLLDCTDSKFDLLKKTAATQLKEHVKMEQAAEKAWKYYIRRVKKQSSLEVKLLKNLTEEQLKSDNKCIKFERKTCLAKFRYQTCFQNEAKHRALLAKQSESLKKEFLKQEKNKLDIAFTFINTMFTKLHKLTPQGIQDLEDSMFELGPVKTKTLALSIWENALKEHVFPDKKEDDVKDRDLGDDNYANMTEDEDSDDEYEDDDDDDGLLFERRVESLRAPKVVNDGLTEVLQEIMDSLDNKPAYETLRAELPSRAFSETPIEKIPGSQNSSLEARPSTSRGKPQSRPRSSFPRDDGQRESIQHAPLDSSDEEYGPKTRKQARASVERVGVSSEARRRRREAKAESEDMKRPSTSRARKSAPDVVVAKTTKPETKLEKKTVYAIADWKKKSQDEISIRVGMKLKLMVGMNCKGLAYGYKKTKFGVKKYGFFPAAHVSCISPK